MEAMNLVGEVEGREILLVDDMTETAGTLTAAAKLLKERGAQKVSAIVSHCVLNETGRERLMNGMLDELITTNCRYGLWRITDQTVECGFFIGRGD